ncbi:MAG: rhamnogalacturonan acetylesterase [Oscillospiraceae bacterium]|jgi:lysophospholipase L1-like esterase|nr:rhamnogalacturonan acetylesterase [Oscillospiraceae bacterium]
MNKTIYLIGDSTVQCDGEPYVGWGSALDVFMPEGVSVQNHAKSGRSTKSFWNEGRFEPVQAAMQPGDLLMICFGHNDEKDDEERHTDPESSYPEMLMRYVEAARAAGAMPVLATSVSRCYFTGDASLMYTHGEYPRAVRDLAAREGLPLIDLNRSTRAWLTGLGEAAARAFFVEGDKTHFNRLGAETVARMAADALRPLL